MSDQASDDVDDPSCSPTPEPEATDLEPVVAPQDTDASVSDRYRWLGPAVAIACAVYVFVLLEPALLFSATTPAGGDMGAHVWGPAYMRDSLLTQGRLVGWTPDWYAGFPAYHYYMVVPALAIIAVNTGLSPWIGIPLAVLVLAAAWRFGPALGVPRGLVWGVAGLVACLLVGVPYGVAFKLVSVLGLVLFPVSAWFLARQLDATEPVPAFAALAATVFLFDTNFWIYGGNIPSTLAGEFAFSLSLCLAFFALGWAGRGMDLDSRRASAAVLIALAALCHVIPMFFLVAGLGLLVFIHTKPHRGWILAIGATLALVPLSLDPDAGTLSLAAAVGSLVVVVAAALVADTEARRRFRWLLVAGPIAALLSLFWLLPFYLREPYFNDMGWERRTDLAEALLTTPMQWFLPVAAVGVVLSVAMRERTGLLFAVLGAVAAVAFAYLPEGKLWNARILPFYYLSVYLLAAVGAALVVRASAIAVSERFDKPDARTAIGATTASLAVVLVGLSIPLQILPFAGTDSSGAYQWLGFRSQKRSMIPGWTEWNYSGYEEKRSYREYHAIVSLMDDLGSVDEDSDGTPDGCGRAMWEYDAELDRYGTPMALMLLPFWTESCITSMEGLYFESSATTPFHFLNQSRLSAAPSRAQRDLPYGSFDIDRGVAQLQAMGVRYYLALSDEAREAAAGHPDLTEVGRSEPWVVYEVSGAETVVGLDRLPVVATGPAAPGEEATRFEVGWVSQAVTAYGDPLRYRSLPAENGPADWERVTTLLPDEGSPVEPAVVTEIEEGNDWIRFRVDEPGRPVLVKTSYFPNWKADGADGPWRVGPNLMVVIPTEERVELRYGYTWAEYAGYGATMVGLAALVVLVVLASRRVPRG